MITHLYKGLGLLLLCCSTLFASCKKSDGGTGTPTVPPPPPGPVWDKNAMRGVWLTTTASTVLDSRTNIQAAVKQCKLSGINAIFMVVYNNGRTTYPSEVMNKLIGKPILEKFSGRDPLKELIEEAAKEQIQVHAWFEYGFASSYNAGGGPILAAKPHWASRDLNGALTL
ncbi:MAG: family 10 glycosylhydrolase, partial [Chitinophagaceae bacterium]|nr:family 10 glycosylhydrolase [Chitinophagaceae bacterium]